jgi:hypothetical protein
MRATAWSNGGGTYGIRVGLRNRDRYFDPNWSSVDVEIDDEVYTFSLTAGFWNRCPEFRDRGAPIIRDWLSSHKTLTWPTRKPPSVELVPLSGNRFRLQP